MLLTRDLLGPRRASFYALMHDIASGNVDGVPVKRARIVELMQTGCFERIDELHDLKFPEAPMAALLSHPSVLAEPGKQVPLAPAEELAIDIATDPAPLTARLAETDNLYEQIELLAALVRLGKSGAEVSVRGSVRPLLQLIEEVYEQAGRLRLWAVVRSAAGLLGKVDGDLSLAVGAILVRQKNIQVGRTYSDDSLITQPIPERELLAKIHAFSREDVRDRVLTQELLLYLGLLIKAQPELFLELITLRVGHLITLLTSQIVSERRTTPDQAYEALMHLAPSEIQERLSQVLAQYHSMETLPQQQEYLSAEGTQGGLDWKQDLGFERLKVPTEGWHAWRQHLGIIDRRPEDFYANVWHIFHHTAALIIGDKLERNRMDSSLVLSDMTPGEKAFALWIEHLLNKIPAPEYRQLTVEALQVLASFFQHNPTLRINDVLSLDAMVGHAVWLAYLDGRPERAASYNDHKSEAWVAFYAASPAETSGFLAAALRHLLTARS